eukprot:360117-Chlamydomonas_euryale.AAC.4
MVISSTLHAAPPHSASCARVHTNTAAGPQQLPCGYPGAVADKAASPTEDSMSRLNLTYACCTEAGLSDGRRKQSQDAWVVKEHVGGTQRVLLGVFDGHGEDGRGVADVVAMAMPKVVAAALETVVRRAARAKSGMGDRLEQGGGGFPTQAWSLPRCRHHQDVHGRLRAP